MKQLLTEDGSAQAVRWTGSPSYDGMTPILPFTESGSGDTILLFLHFFGSSRNEWRHVTEQLSRDYRCVAADMPGFGEAANVSGYSVTQMTASLAALLAHFAPAPVGVVAHSFSGKPAMVLAADPLPNYRQLIMVAPTTLVPEPIEEDARSAMRTRNQSHEGAEEFIAGSHHRDLQEGDLELAIADVLRSNEQAWLAWPDSGSLEDWSDRITELRVPAHLIVGDLDKAIPLAFQKQHTLPLIEKTGGKFIVIEDAAHMLPNEATAELVVAIRSCLA
ncbi:MAG: alpha/beta fold hydrolase [Janthinobacterium lividum]